MKKKISKIWNFLNENHPPTRHLKYKRIDFAPCNKPIMANKLLLSNLERFLRRINSAYALLIERNVVNSEKYIAR